MSNFNSELSWSRGLRNSLHLSHAKKSRLIDSLNSDLLMLSNALQIRELRGQIAWLFVKRMPASHYVSQHQQLLQLSNYVFGSGHLHGTRCRSSPSSCSHNTGPPQSRMTAPDSQYPAVLTLWNGHESRLSIPMCPNCLHASHERR